MNFAYQPRSGGSMVEIDFRFTVHRPRENTKQCGNRFSDERPPNPILTNNAGCDVVCFQIWFVLKPDGLLLFPCSWKK